MFLWWILFFLILFLVLLLLSQTPRPIGKTRSVSVPVPAKPSKKADAFTKIYKNRWWGNQHPNGPGSWIENTQQDQQAIHDVLTRYEIRTMLDVPCGTLSWLSHVLQHHPEVSYTGMDIVEEQVQENQKAFPWHRFLHGDMSKTSFQQYDLVFSKEGTQHMTREDTLRFLKAVRASGSKYLLCTSYDLPRNDETIIDTTHEIHSLEEGAYREQDFTKPPYSDVLTSPPIERYFIRYAIAAQHTPQYLLLFSLQS